MYVILFKSLKFWYVLRPPKTTRSSSSIACRCAAFVSLQKQKTWKHRTGRSRYFYPFKNLGWFLYQIKTSIHITNCKKQSEPTQVFISLHVHGIFLEMIFMPSLVLLGVTQIESNFIICGMWKFLASDLQVDLKISYHQAVTFSKLPHLPIK